MTKEELIKHVGCTKKTATILQILYLVFFFGVLITFTALAEKFKPLSHKTNVIILVLFFGFLFAQIPFLLWFQRRHTKRFGFKCPHCKKLLNEHIHIPIAVASGNCCHCGNRIFDSENAG